ncbi:MAG: hypothetical protein ACMUIG_08325 [Thermoplasmatota archaeon]
MRSKTIVFATTMLLASMAFFVMFAGTHADGNVTRSGGLSDITLWDHDIALQSTEATDGLAMGEVDPTHEGIETVTVSRDSGVYVTSYNKATEEWSSKKIWTSGGQQLTPAIGDLRTDIEGNEILVVGLSSGTEDLNPGDGTATVLAKSGNSWSPQQAFTTSKLIHGAAIGDLDPTIDGNEAVITTFGWEAYLLWYDYDQAKWNTSFIFKDAHNVRKAVIADLLPDSVHPGNEVVMVSKSGNVTLAYGNHTDWTVETIYDGLPLARVCVGDLDPDAGLEIYAGTDTIPGRVVGLKWTGSEWSDQIIFEDDPDKNRGVWIGDVDPSVEGSELYTFGYSTNVYQITGSFGTGWSSRTIFSDIARGHEIRIGNIKTDTPGPEIAVVGYSKGLTVVYPSGWGAEIALTAGDAIDGVAIGEADPTNSGVEIISTSRDSGVYMTKYNDNTEEYQTEKIWTSGGQQLTPAIGDLRTDLPGNEILVVGLSSGTEDLNPGDGTATVLSKSGNAWNADQAFTTSKLIHGADIGDLDPTIDGNEAVITTFGWEAYLLWYDYEAEVWETSFIFKDSHNVRKVVIADLLPDSIHPGNEMVAVSKSGNVTIAYGDHTDWTVETIYSDMPLARVCVGDIDPGEGLEIYAGTDTIPGMVVGFKWDGSKWINQTIFGDDPDKNRGVWVGDVDPDVPGPELYSFGYSRRVTKITGSFATSWSAEVVYFDSARGHEIRIGEILPGNGGAEIAIVGYSRSLTIIGLNEVDAGTNTPTVDGPDSVTINSGETKTLSFTVEGDGQITIGYDKDPALEVSINPATAMFKGSFKVTIRAVPTMANASATLTLNLGGATAGATKDIAVTIVADSAKPSVGDATLDDGTAITEDTKVEPNGSLMIPLSEAVTPESFQDALASGGISAMYGDEPAEADFTLSEDGKTIHIDLKDEKAEKDTLDIKISGLKDEAGNEVAPRTIPVKMKTDDGGGPSILIPVIIVIVVLLVLVVIIGIILFLFMGKEEDGENPEEPKQI